MRAEQSAPIRTPTIRPLAVATIVLVSESHATWLTTGLVWSGFASWIAASGVPPTDVVRQRKSCALFAVAVTSSPQPGRSKMIGEPVRSLSGLPAYGVG